MVTTDDDEFSLFRSITDCRSVSTQVAVVHPRTRRRLFQLLLLVPCRLHSPGTLLGARTAHRSSRQRHASGRTAQESASEAESPNGIAPPRGDELHDDDAGHRRRRVPTGRVPIGHHTRSIYSAAVLRPEHHRQRDVPHCDAVRQHGDHSELSGELLDLLRHESAVPLDVSCDVLSSMRSGGRTGGGCGGGRRTGPTVQLRHVAGRR